MLEIACISNLLTVYFLLQGSAYEESQLDCIWTTLWSFSRSAGCVTLNLLFCMNCAKNI